MPKLLDHVFQHLAGDINAIFIEVNADVKSFRAIAEVFFPADQQPKVVVLSHLGDRDSVRRRLAWASFPRQKRRQ
jgi:hypothetical protein